MNRDVLQLTKMFG